MGNSHEIEWHEAMWHIQFNPGSISIMFIAEKKSPHSKHKMSDHDIVYTTKVHGQTSKCFKVYIIEVVALMCQSLNRLHNIFWIPYVTRIYLISL